MSFCSDAPSPALTGKETAPDKHPRTYGAIARVLAKYVRENKALTFEEAIRRLTSHPADTFNIKQRGRLQTGYFADVAIFDPASIQDNATFINPHQYATGMVHVLVNGDLVLEDGEHTGATPGRFIRGPGWKADPMARN